MLVSNCCGAPPLTETHENMGKCRKCKDGAIFEEEDYINNDKGDKNDGNDEIKNG